MADYTGSQITINPLGFSSNKSQNTSYRMRAFSEAETNYTYWYSPFYPDDTGAFTGLSTTKNASTIFLWHMDGADNATTVASNGKYTTSLVSQDNSNAYLTSSLGKFSSSGYFSGNSAASGKFIASTTTSRLQAISTATGSFTVECWAYPTNNDNSVRSLLHINTSAAQNFGLQIGIYNQTSIYVDNGIDSNTTITGAVTQNAWNHIALTRLETTNRIFVNGVFLFSWTSLNNFSPDQIQLGGYAADNSFNWKGYVDEIRISDVCLYKNSFSPPAEPFENFVRFGYNGLRDIVITKKVEI